MAVKEPKKPTKPALYKMVSVSAIKTSAKNPESKAVSSSLVAFTTSINRIGATLNSAIVVANDMAKTMGDNIRAKNAAQKKAEAQWKEDRLPNTKDKKKGGVDWASKFAGFAAAVVPDFFSSLASLGKFLLRAFVGQALLRWMSNPENGKKLANIVNGVMKVLKWLWTFLTENLFKTIEGLVDMFDSNKSFWDRLKGFGTFLTGFGSLLLGFVFLKKPMLIVNGIRWFVTTLWSSLFRSKAKMTAAVAQNAAANAAGNIPGGGNKGGGGRGLKGLLTNIAVSAGTTFAVNKMMGVGDQPEAPAAPAPQTSAAPAQPAAAVTPAPAPAPAAGDDSQAPASVPRNFLGGIFSKPTDAVIGEKGPEARIPLTQIPANNEQNRKRAGIRPLSSLGGMLGGLFNNAKGAIGGLAGGPKKPDMKKATDLAKMYIVPFKAIGAGVLGSISSVVSSMGPVGKAVSPFLTNIVAPIANAFNLPPNLVKGVQGKIMGGLRKVAGGAKSVVSGASAGLGKLFGKGKKVRVKGKKFTSMGDTTVLGLLTDLNVAAQVIANKIGGRRGGSSSSSSSSESGGGDAGAEKPDLTIGDSIARGLAGEEGTGTETDAQMVGRSSKGVLDYLKSQDASTFKDKTIRLSSGILNSPSDLASVEEQLKLLQKAGAKVQLVGAPTNNPKTAGLNNKLKALAEKYGAFFLGGYEATAGDKIHTDYNQLRSQYEDTVKKANEAAAAVKPTAKTNVTAEQLEKLTLAQLKGMLDPTKTGASNPAVLEAAKKAREEAEAAKLEQEEIEKKVLIASILASGNQYERNTNRRGRFTGYSLKSGGGWISGPMSGYPVSLDGGASTSFIGHGTEWVGYKAAGGAAGSAFVVPFDTPATKNNPNLTGSRLREAKSGGYGMPGFSVGGALNAGRESKSQGKKRGQAGTKKRAAGGRVVPDGPGSSWAAGIPLVTLTTKSGKSYEVAKALAPRFQGFVNDLESTGYKIRDIGGYRPDGQKNADGKGPLFAHPYGAAIDINPDTNGPFGTYNTDLPGNVEALGKKWGLGWGKKFKDAMHFSAMKKEYGAGIGGKEISRASIMGSKAGDDFEADTSSTGGDSGEVESEDPQDPTSAFQKVADAIVKLNSPPTESLTETSEKTETAKENAATEELNKTKTAAANSAAKLAGGSQATANAGSKAPVQPIILPGKDNNIAIESLNPATSILQGS